MIKNSKKLALGIDLGGTNIRVGLVDAGGKVLAKKIELTKKELGHRAVISQMIRMARELMLKEKSILGIGIGSPGPIDKGKGLVVSTPNLPGWKNVKIVEPFKKEFKLPIFFDNDANAAALAEWRFGTGRGLNNVIYLTISTGIGGGIIINGKLYQGLGNAGELGHMIIDCKSKARCGCGNYGDLEALASGTGIAKRFRRETHAKLYAKLTRKISMTSKKIFEMSRKGDKKAKTVITEALTALGIGLVNCSHIFDPEMIVLGGSVVVNNKKIIFPFLRKFVRKRVMSAFKKNVKIVPAKLGDDVGIIGAASLVFESLRKV